MAIQTAMGWLLDASHDSNTSDINLLIKLQDDKLISFKEKLTLLYISKNYPRWRRSISAVIQKRSNIQENILGRKVYRSC
jgi:hypothetical protein